MRNWINNNRRGIELAIILLLLVSKEWTLAIVLGIVWGLEDEKISSTDTVLLWVAFISIVMLLGTWI